MTPVSPAAIAHATYPVGESSAPAATATTAIPTRPANWEGGDNEHGRAGGAT